MLAGMVQELGDSVMVVVKVERVACLSFVRGLYSSTPVFQIFIFLISLMMYLIRWMP